MSEVVLSQVISTACYSNVNATIPDMGVGREAINKYKCATTIRKQQEEAQRTHRIEVFTLF